MGNHCASDSLCSCEKIDACKITKDAGQRSNKKSQEAPTTGEKDSSTPSASALKDPNKPSKRRPSQSAVVSTVSDSIVALRAFKEFVAGLGSPTVNDAFERIGGVKASEISADRFISGLEKAGYGEKPEALLELFHLLRSAGDSKPPKSSPGGGLTVVAFRTLFQDEVLIDDLVEHLKGVAEDCVTAFDKINSDQDDVICRQEFQTFLKMELRYGCKALVDRLFDVADSDSDGQICFLEFEQLWNQEPTVKLPRLAGTKANTPKPFWMLPQKATSTDLPPDPELAGEADGGQGHGGAAAPKEKGKRSRSKQDPEKSSDMLSEITTTAEESAASRRDDSASAPCNTSTPAQQMAKSDPEEAEVEECENHNNVDDKEATMDSSANGRKVTRKVSKSSKVKTPPEPTATESQESLANSAPRASKRGSLRRSASVIDVAIAAETGGMPDADPTVSTESLAATASKGVTKRVMKRGSLRRSASVIDVAIDAETGGTPDADPTASAESLMSDGTQKPGKAPPRRRQSMRRSKSSVTDSALGSGESPPNASKRGKLRRKGSIVNDIVNEHDPAMSLDSLTSEQSMSAASPSDPSKSAAAATGAAVLDTSPSNSRTGSKEKKVSKKMSLLTSAGSLFKRQS